jgi:AraC-like DNA-binding protein
LDCRMTKACTLLTENQCGLKEVASQVGYATEAAFSNAFKRWKGQSPGRYRRTTLTNAKSNGDGFGNR